MRMYKLSVIIITSIIKEHIFSLFPRHLGNELTREFHFGRCAEF